MPLTAVCGLVVQATTPAPLATARVTEALEPVTVLPPMSWTVTTGWEANATPLVAVALGWVVMANWAAAPTVRAKLAVVALVRPADEVVRVKLPNVPVSLQPAKVAMPPVAVCGLVAQARVPVPVATARVTGALEPVTVLPLASWMVTTGCVVKATALMAPAGWVVTANLLAAPAVRAKLAVVAPVRPVAAADKV